MPPVVAAIATGVANFIAGGLSVLTGVGSLGLHAAITSFVSASIYAATANFISRSLQRQPDLGSLSSDPVGLFINSDNPIETRKIIYGRRRVGGQVTFRTTTSAGQDNLGNDVTGNNQFLHIVISLAGHEVDEIETIYFDDIALTLDGNGFATNTEYVDDATISYVRIKKHNGSDSQTADTDLVSEVDQWTVAHQLRGVAYIYVRLQYNQNMFNSIPNITAIVKGAKVFDPRSGLTEWSQNPALCINDYLTATYGLRVPSTEIDQTTLTASANTCEESVTLIDGSTQDRYTCDIVLDTGASLGQNIEQLTSCLAAPVTYSQGTFFINVGAYETPTVTIDESWFISELNVTTRQSRRDLFNAVRGVYIDENKNYVPTDFTSVTNPTYEIQDGGERLYLDIQLGGTVNQERAQRMAKILLEKGRQGISFEATLNMKALQFKVWDTVMVDNDTLGWSAKTFRIVEWELRPNGEGIHCVFQEETAASYSWSAGEATVVDPSPDTNLPNPFSVTAPGAPNVTEALYQTIDSSGLKIKLIVSWAASPDAFLLGYILEYKLSTDSAYIVLPLVTETQTTIFDVEPELYDLRVKAVNRIGAQSAYATSTYDVQGLTSPPSNIANFSLNAINNNAHLSWTPVTDLDVRIGGRILIKHTTDTVTPSWSSANLILPALAGTSNHAVAPLLDGTYMIKAEDSSGIQSLTASTILSNIANIVRMNVIVTNSQDPDYLGSKTNMTITDGNLQLDGAGLFDSQSGNFDDAEGLFDGVAGYETSGSYVFDNYIDIGQVMTSRVTADIEALVYDASNLFDQRSGNFDDSQGLFDGDDISGGQVQLYVRTTNDDPSGSPTWSDWRQFIVGDYTTRAYDFYLQADTDNDSYNIAISSLGVSIDVPDVVDSGSDSSSASVTTTVNFNVPFFAAPTVGATIVGAASGDYIEITSITTTGFDLDVRDSGDNRIAKNVNWIAKGY